MKNSYVIKVHQEIPINSNAGLFQDDGERILACALHGNCPMSEVGCTQIK